MGTDIHALVEVRRDGTWMPEEVRVPTDRNYWAFAVLANVRNARGFAGVKLGEPVTPIDNPRGLPDDCSYVVDDDYSAGGFWLGDHSHSWVTLGELQALDLDTPVHETGMVHRDMAAQMQPGETPEEWCGDVMGQGAEAYVRLSWSRPLRDAAHLLPKLIAVLERCGAPDDVRLVFGFDS